MKLNNKGFALTSIIYMLIVLFLLLLLLVLSNLASRKVVLDKMKYDVKEKLNQGGVKNTNTYTVTFDPNGGEVTQSTKEVVYNELYGELPIPTKEGYEFLGWRGKNMFSGFTKGIGVNSIDGHQINRITQATSDYIEIDFSKNENYYLSGLTNTLWSFVAAYNENNEYIGRIGGMERTKTKINEAVFNIATTDAEGQIKYIRITQYENINVTGTINDIDNLQIQLEPGDTATPYEPYQIYTKDTVVTKNEDHTLYAVWKQKEYQNVDYIGSNGNQYIELDYAAKTNTKIELDIELTENSNTHQANSSGAATIIGRATTNSTNSFGANFGAGSNEYKQIFYWTDKGYAAGGVIHNKTYSSVTERSTMILQSGSATFQGTTIETAVKPEDNEDNMVLLGSNSTGEITPFSRYNVRIYSFKIYEGDILIKNMIPVKRTSDQVLGLYDTINETFYPSNGSQNFN